MKKLCFLLIAAFSILVVLFLGLWYYQRSFPVNEWNYSRIHKGMSLSEVEGLLGTQAFRCHPKHRPNVPSDGEAMETVGWGWKWYLYRR